jgi:hypothetical protein
LNDKRRADVEMLASVGTPDESSCEWLGPPGREAPQRFMRPGGTPTMHSLSPTPFTPMDRGPGFTVRVPRGPEPEAMPLAAGARKFDEGE